MIELMQTCTNWVMNYLAPLAFALALTSCSTTGIQKKAPAETYTSERSREIVSGCLLDRFITDLVGGKIQRGVDANIVTITGGFGNPILVFTVRDRGSGSVTEMRRLTSMGSGRKTTETCM